MVFVNEFNHLSEVLPKVQQFDAWVYNGYSLVNHLIDKRIAFFTQVKSYFSW